MGGAMVFRILLLIAVVIVAVFPAAPAFADDDERPRAVPFVFVGAPGDCGPLPGSNIVTSAWLPGMGLPDNGGPNTATNAADRRFGLLLSKNGLTSDCSAAGAVITNPPRTVSELSFDFRKGGHCGAGAPRFNVTSKAGFTYFFGCAHGVHTPSAQDPQWEHVVFTPADASPASATAPPFTSATRVASIEIIYDEGTDTSSTEDPNGIGLAVLDNISINTRVIRSGRGIAPDPDDREDRRDDD